jgi:rare lipoprotein A
MTKKFGKFLWLALIFCLGMLAYRFVSQAQIDSLSAEITENAAMISGLKARISNLETALESRLHEIEVSKKQSVLASWYGPGFHGRPTANREVFDQHGPTVASPHLPLGSTVFLVNPKTGQACFALVNDRGPYIPGRSMDVSLGIAERLGFRKDGLAVLEVISIGIPQEK